MVAGYIGEFEYVDDHRGGKIVVELNGRSAPILCQQGLSDTTALHAQVSSANAVVLQLCMLTATLVLACSKCTVFCRLNKCGVISPRYDVNHGEIEAWVARLLPSRLVGLHCASPCCCTCTIPADQSNTKMLLSHHHFQLDAQR